MIKEKITKLSREEWQIACKGIKIRMTFGSSLNKNDFWWKNNEKPKKKKK